jgi:RNA polymerase primary sigma factor
LSPHAGDESVRAYLKDIGRARLLTSDEEKRLFLALENGDKSAREVLVEANLRLVASIVKKFSRSSYGFLDLMQEGTIGLMRAVEKFEWRKGYKFSTYATYWIRQAISRGIMDQGEAIRIPVHKAEESARYNRAARALEADLDRKPTTAEIATQMNISIERAREIELLPKSLAVLDAPVGDEETSTLADLLKSDEPPPEEIAQSGVLLSHILATLDGLKERERRILLLRYGFEDGSNHTLEECAKIFDVSRERIRQIEAQALRKLRSPARSRDLRLHWDAA